MKKKNTSKHAVKASVTSDAKTSIVNSTPPASEGKVQPGSKTKESSGDPEPTQGAHEATPVNDKAGDDAAPESKAINPHGISVEHRPPARMALLITNTDIVPPDDVESEKPDAEPLTAEEEQDLRRCEVVIEENKTAWLETTAAMYEIWVKRLYRSEYWSFQQYCKKRWHFSRSYGYRLVKAHETIEKVSTMVDTANPITSGTQALELAKVPEDQWADVVKEAKKNAGSGKMTSGHIKEAARQATPEPAVAKEDNIHPPVTQPDKATPANIITPAEFFPNAEILSLAELSRMADTLHDIFLNPSRNKEAGILLFKVKAHLHMYADWERKHLANASVKEAA